MSVEEEGGGGVSKKQSCSEWLEHILILGLLKSDAFFFQILQVATTKQPINHTFAQTPQSEDKSLRSRGGATKKYMLFKTIQIQSCSERLETHFDFRIFEIWWFWPQPY